MTLAPPATEQGAESAVSGDAGRVAARWGRWGLLAAVAVVALAVGLRLAGRDGLTAGEVVRAVLVVAWGLAGLALLRRPWAQPAGLVVLAGVAASAASCLADAIVALGWRGAAGEIAAFVRPLGLALLPAVGLHLLLGLPRGALGTRGRRVGALIGYGFALAVGMVLWVDRPSVPLWPIWLCAALAVVFGLPASNRRYVASQGVERQRLQWLGCATVVVLEAALLIAALRLLTGWPDSGAVAAGAVTVVIPLALIAGTGHRLVNRVDRILVHTVAAAGLTGVVLGVYLIVVLGLGRVPDDEERSVLLLSMLAAGVAALLYPPAHERLSRFANKVVYGEREAPDELLRSFGSRLSRAIPLDELLLQLAESLRKGMRLTAAEVWTGSHGVLERVVSVPDRPRVRFILTDKELPVVTRAGVSGPGWIRIWLPSLLEGREGAMLRVAPVSNSGELLGLVVVERRGDEPFTEEEERALTELARQVGLALHNVQLDSALQASLDEVQRQADELRASRARIVATADAARRRIERDLHDGAQQQLVALAVNLRLARDLMGEDPEAAAPMLDELATNLKDAIAELRNLAHGIYPPLLVDSGLGEALRAAAARSAVDVEVQTENVGRYPSEVEAAVYFCCLEALQNVAKHAPDAYVIVRVREEEHGLLFEVIDDGPGFDVEAKGHGHGFVNMSDRVGAIGGRVRWESVVGEGSRVWGTVPLRR
ncbi:MAG: histidine kinase [Actinomycetota bacterium]|nr:histidine kinase [Actinomycetota bacterium]